jgi:aspartate kinase
MVAEHFEFLTIILKISFSESLSKDILAQGELLSLNYSASTLKKKELNTSYYLLLNL